MNRDLLLWVAGGAILFFIVQQSRKSNAVSDVGDAVVEFISGWKSVNDASLWLPDLNFVEQKYKLPADLLARMAYQESHFRDDIIRGLTPSSHGALGILQMMPQYFNAVKLPRPYIDAAVLAQIDEAGELLANLYRLTQSWPLAIAAYNAGLSSVQRYNGIPPFAETQNYVASILKDLPHLA